MGEVFLQYQGDGYATVSNYYPQDGERIILTCVPDQGADLDHITATDSYDHSIAVRNILVQPITFKAIWNNLYIEVYFTGAPTPPTPVQNVPVWLLKKAVDNMRKMRGD